MKRKIIITALAAGAVIISTAVAYFQHKQELTLGTFATSQVAITLESLNETTTQGLLPGETRELQWKVTNIGTTEVHLKGAIKKTFSAIGLDPAMIEIQDIWRQDSNGQWQILTNSDTDVFFFSETGTEDNLLTFNLNESITYKVAVKLSETAGNEYQNTQFTTDVEMVAKQTAEGAPWPEFSE